MLLDRINLYLTERRKTTKVEMTRRKRELKIAKTKDAGEELYADFTKFLATYLNALDTDELIDYKIMNRVKAEELVTNMASAHEEVQALLDKLHIDSEKFVRRFWTKMDMKVVIQDTVDMLLKGAKQAEEITESVNVKSSKSQYDKLKRDICSYYRSKGKDVDNCDEVVLDEVLDGFDSWDDVEDDMNLSSNRFTVRGYEIKKGVLKYIIDTFKGTELDPFNY
jgi:hypothetical protein